MTTIPSPTGASGFDAASEAEKLMEEVQPELEEALETGVQVGVRMAVDAMSDALQAAFDAGRASPVGQVAVLRAALEPIAAKAKLEPLLLDNGDPHGDGDEVAGYMCQVCGSQYDGPGDCTCPGCEAVIARTALAASPASPDDTLLDEAMGLLAYWRGEGSERSGDANADTKSLLARYRTRLGK